MKIIQTANVEPTNLTRDEAYFVYNGMDSALTLEIFDKIKNQTDANTQIIYEFELAQMKPALAMMLRGIGVDFKAAAEFVMDLREKESKLEAWLERMAQSVWNAPLNPNSPQQLIKFFYHAMGFPKQFINDKGNRRVSTNRESLEKLHEKHIYARPIIDTILALRDIKKKLSVIKACVDDSGRFRASYNIGGTETGRWSSSKNVFGTGSNAQNITYELREIFVADPWAYIGYIDLSQAESRGVAYLSGDASYIEACESSDLHTYVAKLVWPEISWTGNLAEDRRIAEEPYYRHFSRRDMAKRGGHASNYYGQPRTVARHLKVATAIIEEFQFRYFQKFSDIRRWHSAVQNELQRTGQLTTPVGRRRIFYGRLKDDSTLREAIAFVPQSLIADVLNLALYRIWKAMDQAGIFEILGQVHDAIIFQIHRDHLHLMKILQETMQITVPIGERIMQIPSDVSLGYSWKNQYSYPDKMDRLGEAPPIIRDVLDLPANLIY